MPWLDHGIHSASFSFVTSVTEWIAGSKPGNDDNWSCRAARTRRRQVSARRVGEGLSTLPIARNCMVRDAILVEHEAEAGPVRHPHHAFGIDGQRLRQHLVAARQREAARRIVR